MDVVLYSSSKLTSNEDLIYAKIRQSRGKSPTKILLSSYYKLYLYTCIYIYLFLKRKYIPAIKQCCVATGDM